MNWADISNERDEIGQIEQRCYLLLEEARIRCRQLGADEIGPADRWCLHGHLGLAGYHASEMIDCDDRERCLAVAHGRAAGLVVHGNARLKVLAAVIEQAINALEDAVDRSPRAHLQMANVNALRARSIVTRVRQRAADDLPAWQAGRPRTRRT